MWFGLWNMKILVQILKNSIDTHETLHRSWTYIWNGARIFSEIFRFQKFSYRQAKKFWCLGNVLVTIIYHRSKFFFHTKNSAKITQPRKKISFFYFAEPFKFFYYKLLCQTYRPSKLAFDWRAGTIIICFIYFSFLRW